MRLFRPVSALLATALVAAATFAGPAAPAGGQSAVAGVGTTSTGANAVVAQLGNVLGLALMADESRSTIDPAVSVPEAVTRLTSVAVSSGVLQALNQTLGVYEAKSTGPTEQEVASQDVAPASLPLLGPVLKGTLGSGKLTALVADGRATSGLLAGLTDLDLLGGLLSLESIGSVLGASSGADASGATRGLKIADLTVLDLSALLQGLGINLTDLSISQITGLVDQLGALAGLPNLLPNGQLTLTGAVATVNSLIDQVQSTVTLVDGTVTSVVSTITSPIVNGLLANLGITTPLPSVTGTATAVVDQAQALLGELAATLDGLLKGALSALDDLALLRLEGVEVGAVTKAVQSVDGSVADVTGKIGKIYVGNLQLPGLNLDGVISLVDGVLDTVNGLISGVLSLVSPDLANLVKVNVLDKNTSVTSQGGYTRSAASISAVSAAITPPAGLANLVGAITGQPSAVKNSMSASSVGGLGLDGLMGQLGGLLNLPAALLAPTKVQLANVASVSDYTVPAAPVAVAAAAPANPAAPVDPPAATLPRTGGTANLALFGGLAAVLGVGMRRFIRIPSLRAPKR